MLAGRLSSRQGEPNRALTVVKGRYEFREILGQGGMGGVYKGHDSVQTREVAIKTRLDISDPAFPELLLRGMPAGG